MSKMAVLLTIALLSGCASNQQWYLNGQSEHAFRAADIQCWEYAQHSYAGADYSLGGAAYNAGAAGMGGALMGLMAMNEAGKQALHDDCLVNMGFTKGP
jgi:hypothetical protein